ncbi:MAG: squalene/phytoene synthase family protein [Chthoniobacterales bacterium]
MNIAELRGPILRDVSRSFFLSIRILPRSVRDPVALAYLLARATDTIADTSEIGVAERLDALPALSAAISGGDARAIVGVLRDSFAPRQANRSERSLILAVPDLLQWLDSLDEADGTDIRAVLATITRGQFLDLQRFGDTTRIVALNTAAELDEYAYLVAGCVGEFWTRICSRHVRNFSRRAINEMTALGIAYGKGLQLINILRDVGADLRAGRCYLPADELSVSPTELRDAPEAADSVLRHWLAKAGKGLRDGIEYAAALNPVRIRIATALPALIGLRTIELMQQAGARAIREHIKVSRGEVRSLALRAIASCASPRFLDRYKK